MIHESRVLSKAMLNDFEHGKLKPLLDVVKQDRDLVLEFRGQYATIYCKGHRLDINQCGDGNYEIKADVAFLQKKWDKLRCTANAEVFVNEGLSAVKQAIATHRSTGTEIEFQQALIRANNMEPSLPTDYFAVDQQVLLSEALDDRLDVLGIYWPASEHGSDKDVALALIEVKFGLLGGVEKIGEQVGRYYGRLKANIGDFAAEAQGLLRQKIRLGLITSGSEGAIEKLAKLRVSKEPKQVKIVLAFVDYNPRSTRLDLKKLAQLEFASQIQVFHLGLGLWAENAHGVLARPLVEPVSAGR